MHRLEQSPTLNPFMGELLVFCQVASGTGQYRIRHIMTRVVLSTAYGDGVFKVVDVPAFAPLKLGMTARRVVATEPLFSQFVLYLLIGQRTRNSQHAHTPLVSHLTRLQASAWSAVVSSYCLPTYLFASLSLGVSFVPCKPLCLMRFAPVPVSLLSDLPCGKVLLSMSLSRCFSMFEIVRMPICAYLVSMLSIAALMAFPFRLLMQYLPLLMIGLISLFVGLIVDCLSFKSFGTRLRTHTRYSTSRVLAFLAGVLKSLCKHLNTVKVFLSPGIHILALWTSLVSFRYIRRLGRFVQALFAVDIQSIFSVDVLLEDIRTGVLPILTFQASFNSGKEVGTMDILLFLFSKLVLLCFDFLVTFLAYATNAVCTIDVLVEELGGSWQELIARSCALLLRGVLRYDIHALEPPILASRSGVYQHSLSNNILPSYYTIERLEKLVCGIFIVPVENFSEMADTSTQNTQLDLETKKAQLDKIKNPPAPAPVVVAPKDAPAAKGKPQPEEDDEEEQPVGKGK
jgi:hypothetical protein